MNILEQVQTMKSQVGLPSQELDASMQAFAIFHTQAADQIPKVRVLLQKIEPLLGDVSPYTMAYAVGVLLVQLAQIDPALVSIAGAVRGGVTDLLTPTPESIEDAPFAGSPQIIRPH